MKKLTVIVTSIILVLAAYLVGSYTLRKTGSQQTRIAIFTPTTHPTLEEIEQGFIEKLQKLALKPLAYTTYNANGNRTVLRAQAEEIINGEYDAIFTIGAACSQTIAELIKKKGLAVPHIFSGVEGPGFALMLSELNPSSTGVYLQPMYQREITTLCEGKSIKNLLLVYDPTHGTGQEKYKDEIEAQSKKIGFTLHAIEIYQTNEIQQKVAALLPSMDAVLVLIDNTVVAGIDALITLCNRYGVTLVASDLASGAKGAVLSFGVKGYDLGQGAAAQAHMIIDLGKKPGELPPQATENFQVVINKQLTKLQNFDIDESLLQRRKQ